MDGQNWYGKLFDQNNIKGTQSVYIGMDDDAFKKYKRMKEDRQRAIKDLVKEIDEFGSKTSYYINENGVLQLVHYITSYQLCFYCGDTAVTYVINTDIPYEAFQEKVAFWQTILIGSGIGMMVLMQPLMQGQFRNVIWAMDGNLFDSLQKLPFENL